ncbi:MAG: pyridoxamine 5'-phosphate oxidase family protein [Thermomicrobiales bacterium]
MTEKAFKEQTWRGKIGSLDDDEVIAFLNEGVLARLAVVDGDGFPYVNPVWFEWVPEEGIFWIIARKKSRWAEYMKNNPTAGLTIDDDRKPLRKVMVQGLAEVVEEPNVGGRWVQIAERMSLRYLGENGPEYLGATLANPRWLFRITPTFFTTWQGVDWHDRYKD